MTPAAAPLSAVFLDRDGTIIEERHYLSRPQDVVLLPTAATAIAALNRAKVPVFVVTNQAGIARGYFSEAQVEAVHDRLNRLLLEHGAHIDEYFICPHHPEFGLGSYKVDCSCRKPKPGMLWKARDRWGLDMKQCAMIGDKLLDLEAGTAAGCRSLLVLSGYGPEVQKSLNESQAALYPAAKTLWEAIEMLSTHRIHA